MADLVCLKCAQPILPGDAKSTIQQVDACTLAVEHLPYHSACWELEVLGARRVARNTTERHTRNDPE